MKKLIMSVLVLLFIVGCAHQQNGDQEPPVQQPVHSQNGALASKIVVQNPVSVYKGDLLRVRAFLVNTGKSAKDLGYKVRWFDRDGFEVMKNSEPWTPITIERGGYVQIEALAPNPSVKDYEIWVK